MGNILSKMRIILLFFFLSLLSCKNQPHKETQRLNLGLFSLEAPKTWKQVKEKVMYDSYVGRIAVDNTDTIYFDLGWYSNDLSEYVKMNLGDSDLFYLKEKTGNKVIRGDSIMIDSLIKSRFIWGTVDNRKAKIVFPKKSGIGITGIYIDSLWNAGNENDKFNFYGVNLKPKVEKVFLESLKTLRFTKK